MAAVRKFRPFLALVLLVAACMGGPGTRTGETSIDRSFTHTGFRWAEGGLVHVFLKVRPSEGAVEICAAWMYDDDGPYYADKLNYDKLQAASVWVEGNRVINGLGFAQELPKSEVVLGRQANCAHGGAPWKPSYASAPVTMKIPRYRPVY